MPTNDTPNFYQRMQDAKKRKKQRLEQEQLEAEFLTTPESFNIPNLPPIIVKTESEQKLDAAFSQLQAKLHAQVQRLQDKAEGL